MNVFWQNLTPYPLTEIVGWALLHFFCQSLVIGFLLFMLLVVLRRHQPQPRYLLACAGLLLMAAAAFVTAGTSSRVEKSLDREC